MDIAEILGWVLFVYLMYQLLTAWYWYRRFNWAVDEAVQAEMKKRNFDKENKVVRFENVEENGHSVVLVYDVNNRFITQGNTKQDAIEALKLKFPNQNIVAEKATVDNNS